MWRLVFRWLTSTCYSSDFIQLSDDCTELSICETYALFCVSKGNEDMGSSLIDISNFDAEDELELDNPIPWQASMMLWTTSLHPLRNH